ncbi:hypothetical protein J6590_095499 [Homalodisca vitripennis]|nr:hypothetical protein J6590_095499 [Homalodisca vitripennis]
MLMTMYSVSARKMSLIDDGVQVQDELSDDFHQNLSDSDAENESDISVRASDDNQSDVDDTDDDPDFILPSDNEELLDSECLVFRCVA